MISSNTPSSNLPDYENPIRYTGYYYDGDVFEHYYALGDLVRGRKKVSVDDALEAFDEDEGSSED